MASAFGHAFSALAVGSAFNKSIINWKFWVLGMVCSILPDADVIAFAYGVPYESVWGHRGFTHSFLFALILAVALAYLFYSRVGAKTRILLILYFFICTASHSVLDALTNGGLGVAFFFPFENSRYFFPWRPIQVSPIGVDSFFTERGVRVIMSELLWIGVPGTIVILLTKTIRKSTADAE
jgi:inner membrane protein